MKRKELEKLPVLRATTAMLKQAENEPMIESGYFRKELRYEHEYYARCKRFDRILKVAIYLTQNLAAGGKQLRFAAPNELPKEIENLILTVRSKYSYLYK